MKNPIKIKFYLHIILFEITLIGCVSNKVSTEWEYKTVPKHKEINMLDFSIIDVELPQNTWILKKLDKKDFVVLNQNEDTYEIAIRALYTNLGGVFEVYENDDNSISVFHSVLGSCIEEVHKAALKVHVKKLPKAIYVFYSMDS